MGAVSSKQGTLVVQKPKRRKSEKGSKRTSKIEKEKTLTLEEKQTENSKDATEEELKSIENKLELIEKSISDASKDQPQINILSENLEALTEVLQKLETKNNEHIEERKNLLEKEFMQTFQRLTNIKKLLIVGTKDFDSRLEELHEMEQTLNPDNFGALRNSFINCKDRLSSIEEVIDEIILKKSEVSKVITELENKFTKIEMENRVKEMEHKLENFLQNLRNVSKDVEDIVDVSTEVSKRKQLLLEKVKNILEVANNANIEENIKNLKPKIFAFEGVDTSDEYFELAEALTQINMKLEEVKDSNKFKMLEEVKTLQQMLDKTASGMTKIHKIGEEIETISSSTDDSEELLKKLKFVLLQIESNEKLDRAKEECYRKINESENKLKSALL